MLNTQIKTILKVIVACVFFGLSAHFIAAYFEIEDISRAFSVINWVWFFTSNTLLLLVYWWIRTLRWRSLLASEGFPYPLCTLIRVNVFAMSAAIISPMQSGEALKIATLKVDEKQGRSAFLKIFLVEKFLDLGSLFLLVLLSLPFGAASVLGSSASLGVGGVSIGVVVFFCIIARGKFQHSLWRPIFYTWISWFLVAGLWSASLYSVECALSFGQSLLLVGGTTVASIVSMIPGGIGAADTSAYIFLQQFGVEETAVKNCVIVLRIMGGYAFLIGLIVSALLYWAGRRRDSSN